MAKFKHLTPTEFMVEDYRIYKDGNGEWVSHPPISDPSLQREVHNYISNLKDE